MTNQRNTAPTPAEKQAQETERDLWSEVFRLLDCARTKPDEQLLEAMLNGREANKGNVKVLVRMAQTHFERDVKERILAVCEKSLGPDELKKLKKPLRESPRQDGFDPKFINLDEAFARVISAKLFDEGESGTPIPATYSWSLPFAAKVLGVALNGATVTQETCQQLWYALQYYWKKQIGSKSVVVGEPSGLPMIARGVGMCVCKVSNESKFRIEDAACLSFTEAVVFRS